jgi:hypothetical protein
MKTDLLFFALCASLFTRCDSVDELNDNADASDTDTDGDCDEDGGQGDCEAPWGWYDATSGLCWENPPTTTDAMAWADAAAYCDALVLGGHCDWRLPSISELRTFVRGCDALMPGGECGVTDDCTDLVTCWNESGCGGQSGCDGLGGPGEGGMYWDPEIIGGGVFIYWSATGNPPSSNSGYVFYIRFSNMILTDGEAATPNNFRCVRTGL